MVYYIPIFILIPVLFVIWLIGFLTMVIPALKRFHPLLRHLFFSMSLGSGVGFVTTMLLSIGLVYFSDWLSNLVYVSQTINTTFGLIMLIAPVALPFLGAAIGLTYSLKKRKQLVRSTQGSGFLG